MSDPASNSDIEDVLSSIRRLVSEEPPKRDARSEEDTQSVERLVLTPAFRVPDPEPLPEAAQLEHDLPEPRGAANVAPMVLEQPILPEAELNADADKDSEAPESEEVAPAEEPALLASEDDADADAADDPSLSGMADVASAEPVDPAMSAFEASDDWTAPTEAAPVETTPELSEPEPVPEPPQEHVDPADMSLEDRIAELEAAIQHSEQEWEPDGSEDGGDDETRPISENLSGAEALDIEADLGFAAPETDRSEADVDVEPAPDGADHEDKDLSVEALSAAIHSLEEQAAEAPIPDDNTPSDEALPVDNVEELSFSVSEEIEDTDLAEPVEDPQDIAPLVTEAADVLVPSEAPPAEVTAVAEEEYASAAPLDAWDEDETEEEEASENILADDVSTIDEETLREMVSDLVREELQGVLGERITRNVRRLVRREIQRALAVRDLE